MKILDRYLIRETVLPFVIAFGMFTFLLAVNPFLGDARDFLAKGVTVQSVAFLLLLLVPQALGLAIPMAFMTGVLMGLGRLSGDREAVALLACGVSPLRLLRPIMLLALLAGAVDMYVLMELVPDSNQRYREETVRLLAKQGERDIKPGRFYQGFPGKVILVQKDRPGGGWSGVFLADTSDPSRAIVSLSDSGYLDVDFPNRQVLMVLPDESSRYQPGEQPATYDVSRVRDVRFPITAESVFGGGNIVERGNREMKIPALRKAEEEKRKAGISPHPEIILRHQMFAFPVACLVFAMLGLALGLHTRKEGKLGGFTLGIVVIFLYNAIMVMADNRAKVQALPAEWARWIPNIVLGLAGAGLIWWRSRTGELQFALPARVVALFARQKRPDSAAPAPRRVVLVVRVPNVATPRPRLLDLYVAGQYLRVMLLTFVGLLSLYYIITFIDKSEKLFKGLASGWLLAEYLYYSTPQYLAWIVPMATLVAVLATLGGLMRTGELVVMRACGVSLYRAAAPLFVLGLIWSGGLFLLDDRVLASANEHAHRLDSQIRSGVLPAPTSTAAPTWLADESGRIYHYSFYDQARRTLYGLSVFETTQQPYRLTSHTYTSSATFSRNAWHAEAGWVQHFPALDKATRQGFARRTLSLLPPDTFSGASASQSEFLTFNELRKHIAEHSASGFSLAESRVSLQGRIAFPLVTLVMTVLGIPFAVTTGRRGALYGVGIAIILSFAYWLLNTFFMAVGQADLLPPALAAWAANLLFLAVAGYLALTVRT